MATHRETFPKLPWKLVQGGVTTTSVADAHGTVIARTFCDRATSHKTYNEQWAQAENLADLFMQAPALLDALKLCVESLDQLLPYLAKTPADVGLLNEALCAARPLLTHFE
jgi:hypothetical protein